MKIPPALAVPAQLVPLAMVQRATSLVFSQVMRQHPTLFERLGEHVGKRFGFVPSDLPFAFLITPEKNSIGVVRKGQKIQMDAGIEGPFVLLLAVLEGKLDADALFFSRDIMVTGDMEAMLALRNALDDCNVDLPTDLGASTGAFGPAVRSVAEFIRRQAFKGDTPSWN
ncbi:MAG: ubiquinone anaerobic biosynthesis accessory factor UbiT [Phyllobacterium sp.]